jgi:hypothetical protein
MHLNMVTPQKIEIEKILIDNFKLNFNLTLFSFIRSIEKDKKFILRKTSERAEPILYKSFGVAVVFHFKNINVVFQF